VHQGFLYDLLCEVSVGYSLVHCDGLLDPLLGLLVLCQFSEILVLDCDCRVFLDVLSSELLVGLLDC